jgi:hypothetical protein
MRGFSGNAAFMVYPPIQDDDAVAVQFSEHDQRREHLSSLRVPRNPHYKPPGHAIYFNREGGIEVALGDMTGGGQLKTNKRVQFAGLQHRSAPFPADPAHPRAVWLRAIQRGMSFRSLRVARGTADAGRITANIRRLLPSDLLRLPSARYVSAKSCRKTMASAANAAGVPLRAIQQHGLWGEKSETAARNYIDRSYPIQPYTALVFDFLLDVGQAAVIMAI